MQMTLEEFGKKIKAKYPQYASYSDADIANKVLAKYPQYKSAITQTSPTQKITPEDRTVGNYLSEGVRGVGRGLKNDVEGAYQAYRHPLQTAKAISDQAAAATHAAEKEFKDTSAAPLYERAAAATLTGLENAPIIGGMVQHDEEGGTRLASPEALGAAAEMGTTFIAPDVAVKGLEAIPKAKTPLLRSVVGTGPKVAEDLAEKTRAANEAAEPKAQEEQQNYNRKIGETVKGNRKISQQQAARDESTAQMTARGQQIGYDINKLSGKLRQKAGDMFDAVREKVGKASTPGTDLGKSARNALSVIKGTSETPKIFKDIIGKYPEADPETIDYQGAQIPKGHPLYEVLKQQGAASVPEVSFGDLQGYYSELGRELSKGILPDDVYRATKQLQSSVGDMMQEMADKAGAGDDLKAARKSYREYMETFHEPTGPSGSGSPVAQSLDAADPLLALKPFLGDSGDRGVNMVRKYDPELADRIAEARRIAEGRPRTVSTEKKSIASLKKPEPFAPKKIGTEDIRKANEEQAKKFAQLTRTRGTSIAIYVTLYRTLAALAHSAFGGVRSLESVPGDIAEGVGLVVGSHWLANAIETNPTLRELLTSPSPKQIEAIPPELRGDLGGLIKEAKKEGIKLSPAFVSAITGSVTGPKTQHLQDLADEHRYATR